MVALAKTKARADRDALRHWVERVASFFHDRYGLPPITGRILGWLMICEPPEQSAADIAHGIGASRASLIDQYEVVDWRRSRAPNDAVGRAHSLLPD